MIHCVQSYFELFTITFLWIAWVHKSDNFILNRWFNNDSAAISIPHVHSPADWCLADKVVEYITTPAVHVREWIY